MPSPARPAALPVIAALGADFARRRAELAACIPRAGQATTTAPQCGLSLGRENARLIDGLLATLFAACESEAKETVALAGVGGYGRGALALRSDVDLKLLARDLEAAASVADALLYPLWDMGVAVGHQVVTAEDVIEAARTDLPTATALLDWRHVAGDRALSDALRTRAEAGLFAGSELPGFMKRLEREVAQRHERFGGSVYLLEPDVKNGAGGLRDLDVARWAASARYRAGELDELVRLGALLPREALEIQDASEGLWRIRNLLHAHAGRRSDRLTFDEQETIAPLLGYGQGGDGVERMMSAYYRNARAISTALETMLARATPILTRRRPRDEDLGDGVRMFERSVTLTDPERLRLDPPLALRLVSAAVEREVPLLPYARGLVMRASADPAWAEELRTSPEAASRFRALVASRKDTALTAGSALRELHALGLLIAMIPEFSPVVGRVHHDVYHVYTVDVHSVAAVDRLVRLVRGELASEFPLACRLAAEITRPEMLFFAALLHDVGKAIGGSEHSQRGAEMARPILGRLGLSPDDVEEAVHLVRSHLTMYHVATRRDLDDPGAIAEFSREVHGREGLRDLYLLTVADVSTTSPTSMTSWKARMLDELYLATDAWLGGTSILPPSPGARSSSALDARAAKAALEIERAALELPAAGEAEREAQQAFLRSYLASMPERYVLYNAPAAIAAHAELARHHGEAAASVALVPSRHPEAAEICVVAADRPGLLAAITAAIAASRLEVHAAQIHSRVLPDGGVQAVDLFWVVDRGEGVSGVARALPKLGRDLCAVLAGELDARELARRRMGAAQRDRATPEVTTQVSLDDRASSRHTVLEVLTRDRPGLLFAVSDCLYRLGLSIAVAKINTEGTRVADVFYVGEADGSKVATGKRTAEVRDRLLAALEALVEKEGTS